MSLWLLNDSLAEIRHANARGNAEKTVESINKVLADYEAEFITVANSAVRSKPATLGRQASLSLQPIPGFSASTPSDAQASAEPMLDMRQNVLACRLPGKTQARQSWQRLDSKETTSEGHQPARRSLIRKRSDDKFKDDD